MGWLRRIGIAAAVLLAAAIVGLSIVVLAFCGSDRICKGVTVAGVSVAGMSRAQAKRAIDRWWSSRLRESVTLTALDTRPNWKLDEFGAGLDARKTAQAAYSVGRRGGVFQRFSEVLLTGSERKRIKPKITFDEAKLRSAVKQVARLTDRPHKDAALKVVDGRIEVQQDSAGIKVNEAAAESVLRRELAGGSNVVALPVETDAPEVTAADAVGIDTVLSRFTTSFNAGRRDRTHNLRLAAGAVSGIILRPGDKFSYNELVGPRVTERGYRNAPIFVRGVLEPGVGGGVCQVSSTVYNTALLAGLKIVERHHHSRLVPYARPGRDATVNYGHLDLMFENSNSNPVGMIAAIECRLLTVSVYGSASDKKSISVYTGKASYRAAGSKTVTDSKLASGKRKVADPGSPRVSVTVYRKTLLADGKTATEVVSRDTYPAQSRIIAHGPVASMPSPSAQKPESTDARSSRGG